MTSRHRKNWPYIRQDGSVVWMRAATEVAWATWLDKAGKAWEYEPTAFLLSTGRRYVPDFFLKEEGGWHEVKGHETAEAMAKYEEFARDHRCQIITVPEIEQALGMQYRDLLRLAKRLRDEYNASKHTAN